MFIFLSLRHTLRACHLPHQREERVCVGFRSFSLPPLTRGLAWRRLRRQARGRDKVCVNFFSPSVTRFAHASTNGGRWERKQLLFACGKRFVPCVKFFSPSVKRRMRRLTPPSSEGGQSLCRLSVFLLAPSDEGAGLATNTSPRPGGETKSVLIFLSLRHTLHACHLPHQREERVSADFRFHTSLPTPHLTSNVQHQ